MVGAIIKFAVDADAVLLGGWENVNLFTPRNINYTSLHAYTFIALLCVNYTSVSFSQ